MTFSGSAINVSRWAVGDTPRKQKVVILECGEAHLAVTVGHDKVRSLARYLIEASFNIQSTDSLRALWSDLWRIIRIALHGCFDVFRARCRRAFFKGMKVTSSLLSGQSLFVFQFTAIKRNAPGKEYAPVQSCIYCDTPTYSTKPHVRKHPLGFEHIVAEGLGGTLELPEASCQECEDATGRLVEGQVLGNTLKALRAHLNLKKPGTGRHPKTLPISAVINGAERVIEIPTEDYPIVFNMLVYPAPDVANVNTEQGRAIVGVTVATLKVDHLGLFRKHGASAFHSAVWDNQMLCRMLAKIAHSYAIAELGRNKFSPLLRGLIKNGDISAMNLVGGDDVLNDGVKVKVSPSALHELTLGYQRINGTVYVVVRVRLFASNGGPFYVVVVGESLETRVARVVRIAKHSWLPKLSANNREISRTFDRRTLKCAQSAPSP